jgi:hypothetical protein
MRIRDVYTWLFGCVVESLARGKTVACTFPDPFSLPGNWYKGNLHTHTTESDGALDPFETVRRYRQHGYDFLAITDHNRFTVIQPSDRPYLLSGEEIDVRFDNGLFHIVAIGTSGPLPFTPTRRADLAPFEVVAAIKGLGGEAILAHPYWSNETTAHVLQCEGVLGVEVYNHGCEMDNANGLSAVHWDDMLRAGMRVHGFATDDSHHHGRDGTIVPDAFGGWVMVKAESLSTQSIMSALRAGHFYASSGPEIRGIRYDDEQVQVDTSPVQSICLRTPQWGGWRLARTDKGLIEQARFSIPKSGMLCARIECTDSAGRRAWSNAMWFSPAG